MTTATICLRGMSILRCTIKPTIPRQVTVPATPKHEYHESSLEVQGNLMNLVTCSASTLLSPHQVVYHSEGAKQQDGRQQQSLSVAESRRAGRQTNRQTDKQAGRQAIGADRLKLKSLILSYILHHSPDCRQEGLHLVLTCLHTPENAVNYSHSAGAEAEGHTHFVS